MSPGSPPSALTFRALAVGLPLSVVVAMYSAYAGLKVGGVYWPILTATLLAMALFKPFGGASRQEITVAATAASTGGLLAAGLIFTVPAGWLLGIAIGPLEITLVAIVGGLLGVLFTLPLRVEMLERLALPYPDGAATARVIEAGDAGGRDVRRVLGAFGVAGLFALVRDGLRWLPPVVSVDTLGWGAARWLSLGSSVSLVPFAGGFLIGPRFTALWLAGGAAAWWLAVPTLVLSGRFPDKAAAAAAVRPFGIGVIVGASVVYFLARGVPALGPMLRQALAAAGGRAQRVGWLFAAVAAVVVTARLLDLGLGVALVGVVGALFVAYIAARIAGELNIDPMEIFAIAILILLLLFVELPARSGVLLAAILCLSAGMAGDFMQDLKAGALLGTRPRDQALAQIVSVFVAASVLGVVLTALAGRYAVGSAELPAPQAVALAAILRGDGLGPTLGVGAALGALATGLSLWRGQGIAPIAVGIGLYAPIELSLPLALGGLLRAWATRRGVEDPVRLLAAGAIGGEGFVGVVVALVSWWLGR